MWCKEPDTAGCVNAISLMLTVNEDKSLGEEHAVFAWCGQPCTKAPCLLEHPSLLAATWLILAVQDPG